MNTKRSSILLAVILFTAVPASIAYSALNDDPAALVADQVTYIKAGPTLYGYVDYAVYAPGDYLGSLSFPDKFVYCYQIFNLPTSTPVSTFSVDLIPDTTAVSAFTDSASVSGAPGGSIPVSLVSDIRVSYIFGRNAVLANQHSAVLLFTSDSAPTFGNGLLTGTVAGSFALELPTPIPEPSTLLLFTLAAPVLVKTRKQRLTK